VPGLVGLCQSILEDTQNRLGKCVEKIHGISTEILEEISGGINRFASEPGPVVTA
jgi:hypothetical protein